MVFRDTQPAVTEFTIRRVVPEHFVAGQPFPVFLHINAATEQPTSVIVQEVLPAETQLVASEPPISGQDRRANAVKWLRKINGPTMFAYTVSSKSSLQGTIIFDGHLKLAGTDIPEMTIDGDRQTTTGSHHWADSNRDNRISDEEILVVYDLIGSDPQIGIDMDLIETIWLGDGYLWHPGQQRFTVLE